MSPEIPRDASGRVIRPRPSQLLMDVMDKLGPDHLTTRTLMAALIERDRGAGVEPRAVTPTFGWHLPVLADPPNVPYDMQENSLDIEATVSADTGNRNIAASLINGWTLGSGGWVRVRRVGSIVFVFFHQLTVPATFNPSAVGVPPAGFGAGANVAWGTVYNVNNALGTLSVTTELNTSLIKFPTTLTGGHVLRGAWSYPTSDPFPTVLPGVPA